mmetsp:Transcript_52617/g.111750  ORF Transcript_52617/g.111750 Transcript_52617/m.111750 type:complete len:332 (-) Transcript_52617:55-1050(-)
MSDSKNGMKWIGDGSEGGKLDVTEKIVKFASATQGTPFNVRADDDGAHEIASYYEVKVTDMSEGASLGVGLVKADGFQSGWKTKGYFYNGNITNGSAGLIIGFGDRINEGDVVGVYQQRSISGEGDTSRKCSILFYHNGRCLGAGFSLHENDEKLYPCLHLSGSATVTFSIPPPPSAFEREQTIQSHDDLYGGDWAIEQSFVGPELGELPIPAESKFRVTFERVDAPSSTESKVRYQLFIKISNSFRTSLVITGKVEAFHKIEFDGHCMTTRKRPRPAFQKMEQLIQSALSKDGGCNKLVISEQGQLIMSGPTAEIICSRFVEAFEPVQSM